MPLVHVAVLAVARGFAEALGISASGLEAAARVLLEAVDGRAQGAVEAGLAFGAALAVGVAVRRRMLAMIAQTVRAIARPALFRDEPGGRDAVLLGLSLAAAAGAAAACGSLVTPWQGSPIAAGVGLLTTGLGLASTALAPRGTHESPSHLGALAVGLAHGAAALPGASRLGAALTVLLWIGVRPQRAVEFALLMTSVTLVASATAAVWGAGGGADFAAVAVGGVLAFASAAAGAATLRALTVKRRLGVLALCTWPLGLALLAYARALPAS